MKIISRLSVKIILLVFIVAGISRCKRSEQEYLPPGDRDNGGLFYREILKR
jgi:hypothetical protein